MTCYFRRLREVFQEAGIEITKDNKREIDRIIHGIVGVEYKNCPAAWREVKRRLAEDKEAFRLNCNLGLVDLEPVEAEEDVAELKELVEKHSNYTGSTVAASILDNWNESLPKFIRVMQRDYKRALEELAAEQAAEQTVTAGGQN